MKLEDATDAVLDAVIAQLNDLEDIKTIVRGDRASPPPEPPALWVWHEEMTCQHVNTALREEWSMPIVLAAFVYDNDPTEGYDRARKMAAQARSAVLSDRTLGMRGTVRDVRSTSFSANPRMTNDKKTLFWADAVVTANLLLEG